MVDEYNNSVQKEGKVAKDEIDAALDDLENGNEEIAETKEAEDPAIEETEPEPVSTKKKKIADSFPEEYVSIATSAITKIADTNTRGDFKEDQKFKGLCESIAEVGVFSPMHVSDNGDGTYMLLAGSRRLEAAKRVGMRFIPVVVVRQPQDKTMVSAIENLTRADLNPVEEAKAYKVLMEGHNISQNMLSKRLGISQALISIKLALLCAPQDMLDDLIAGRISESDVRNAMKEKTTDSPIAISIPDSDLPDGVEVKIRNKTARVTFKFDIDNMNDIGQDIKAQITGCLEDIDNKRVMSSYKAVLKESKK